MKLWIDDVRPAPKGEGYFRYAFKSVDFTKSYIERYEKYGDKDNPIELLDLDHDAGAYAIHGGDFIKLLDWLEETGRNYPIRIHTMNVVGAENMRRIIRRNGWTEIQ